MLKSAVHKLLTMAAKLTGKYSKSGNEFSNRIKNRYRIFWKSKDVDVIKVKILNESDPMEKWKEEKNWQRKLSNKHNSKEFARKHNCKVAELYWKGKNYDTIDFDNLPDQYVIKPIKGHSSRLVFLMDNGVNLMDGKIYAKEDIKELLAKALNENKTSEFLFEEFLRTENGVYKIPDDYKFYMFNGEVASVQVINRLGPSKGFTTCYNENWQVMENVNTYYPKGEYQNPPASFQEMLQRVKELSKAYEIFVRIDFYATDKGAVFGEFTPTPFRGSYFSLKAEKLFSTYWDRFCNQKV
jgi:hypothetical protein